MADGTSGSEAPSRIVRDIQRFDTIVVVGGGCYGGYYVRQLGRAHRAGALGWRRLLVVDRNPCCAAAALATHERPPGLELVTADWRVFFDRYLASAAVAGAEATHDAIVPSPLMPHLMADWLMDRARDRWPSRAVAITPIGTPPATPWQRASDDGTHYLSFAEWMCPINCVEPERCPHTRGPRDWSLPVTLRRYASAQPPAERPVIGPYLFHCRHRAYGVGMLDVSAVVDADRAIASLGADTAVDVLVGTVSHCHGALRRIRIGH